MIENKWLFTTVPFINEIKKEKATVQSTYLWMCFYANMTWKCFASQKTIADNAWITRQTLIQNIKRLKELWLIKEIKTKWNVSNKYILTIDRDMEKKIEIVETKKRKKKKENTKLTEEQIKEKIENLKNYYLENKELFDNQEHKIIKYMIELWYNLVIEKKSIEEFKEWYRQTLLKFVWYKQDWSLNIEQWEKITFNWYSYHKDNNKVKNYKSSLLTFFNNYNKYRNK